MEGKTQSRIVATNGGQVLLWALALAQPVWLAIVGWLAWEVRDANVSLNQVSERISRLEGRSDTMLHSHESDGTIRYRSR